MSETLLLTGATGFIGTHLLKRLSDEDKIRIKVLARNGVLPDFSLDNIEVYKGDLLAENCLTDFIETDATLINLAHLSTHSIDDNLSAAQNLARVCAQKKVRRLIHCSTAVVIGRSMAKVITEDSLCRPVTAYEQIKLETENILLQQLKNKVEVIVIRPTAVFGEGGQNLSKMANDLISGRSFITSLKASLFYRRRMNLVCVDNVVAAILFISRLKKRVSGERFIISDDDVAENNYLDIISMLSECFELNPPKIIYIPYRYVFLQFLFYILRGRRANVHRIYSPDKLIKLGFEKSLSFDKGIKRFASWYHHKSVAHS